MNSPPALRPDVTLDGLNELGTEYLPSNSRSLEKFYIISVL